jgi:thiol-disulfide isomerase/thioredoxin
VRTKDLFIGSDASPRPVNVLSRRDVVLHALTGMTAAFASPSAAAAPDDDVPSFDSGRYQFTILRPRQELPSLRLFRLEGGTTELSSLLGRPILLNFWASWCPACRMELPALDARYRGAWRGRVNVAAISEDHGPHEMIARFVKSLELKALPIYLDPNRYVAHSNSGNSRNAPFVLYGMPITYVISSSGSIVGYMPGEADWSSPAADDLIEYLRET